MAVRPRNMMPQQLRRLWKFSLGLIGFGGGSFVVLGVGGGRLDDAGWERLGSSLFLLGWLGAGATVAGAFLFTYVIFKKWR